MHFVTGKKEMITILLVGLCLNLSTFHFHTLSVFSDSDEGDIPHHIEKEVPVCFACQQLTAGIQSFVDSRIISTSLGKAGQFISIEAETDFSPASVSNKSPPL
ncbi:MAG TPA: hypothetical protein VJ905_08165 [Halalkalibaculum sp.]|nr:hypothetical protein [Halalkalibaculum sp.]